ncbi:TPA: phage antirepressor KilAC domain-containing protein [Streptococcus agalactiae]|nr:antA/AntB antirepressor family protein [Streptococcus agalactiae]
MNELITVTLNDSHEPVVSGRQLHEALGVRTRYDNWFSRMTEYGFTENQDYLVTSIFGHNSNGGRQNKVDHIVKLDMAKEIAMIQRTDKGKQVRTYFIQIEKDYNSPEKIMKQNGIDIGQNKLFQWLRGNGYLISRRGESWNQPTQKSMQLGLFELKKTNINHADGHTTVNTTTKVTGKGQQYFINKFLNQEYLPG